jgi:DNA-binding XRE family transcriptional regulator
MKTNLQIINSTYGKPEYVLLPFFIYDALKDKIEQKLECFNKVSDYCDFDPKDFIKNPIALARMKANITQATLAKALNTSQAYISKIENDDYSVNEKLLTKIIRVIKKS